MIIVDCNCKIDMIDLSYIFLHDLVYDNKPQTLLDNNLISTLSLWIEVNA